MFTLEQLLLAHEGRVFFGFVWGNFRLVVGLRERRTTGRERTVVRRGEEVGRENWQTSGLFILARVREDQSASPLP